MTPEQLQAEGWSLIAPSEVARGTLNMYVCVVAQSLDGHGVYMPVAKRPMATGTAEQWWKAGTAWLTDKLEFIGGAVYGKKAGTEMTVDAARALEQGFRGSE